jgi:hypothetical protein
VRKAAGGGSLLNIPASEEMVQELFLCLSEILHTFTPFPQGTFAFALHKKAEKTKKLHANVQLSEKYFFVF